MITLYPIRRIVSGTSYRRVYVITLPAGTFDIDCVLGTPGSVSTATALVRRTSDSSTQATLTSSADPARLSAQRFTLGVETEVEVVVANSSASVGLAMIDSIRISDAPLQLYTNGIKVRLADNVLTAATSIPLASGSGAQIGLSPSGGSFFLGTLQNSTGTIFEVVRCTGRTGDTLTVTRSQEGTSARDWPVSGTFFVISNTAATLNGLQVRL